MTYYKPLDNLNVEDVVQLNKIGAEEQGRYGRQRQCEVVVNGQPLKWTLSLVKHAQLTEAGFKEGDTVKIFNFPMLLKLFHISNGNQRSC